MNASQNPDVAPGVDRTFTPMKPPTYAEALTYILQTPRYLATILSFFAPADKANALDAMHEMATLGRIERQDGLYVLTCKRSAS